jgi:hypothetical protein
VERVDEHLPRLIIEDRNERVTRLPPSGNSARQTSRLSPVSNDVTKTARVIVPSFVGAAPDEARAVGGKYRRDARTSLHVTPRIQFS